MSAPISYKADRYHALVIFIILLVPVLNLTIIRFGFDSLFQNKADLILFLFYSAPLWSGFALFVGFEIFRRSVIQVQPSHHLDLMMTSGGFVFSILSILLCPTGPHLFSLSAAKLILVNTFVCTVLGFSLRLLLGFRYSTQD